VRIDDEVMQILSPPIVAGGVVTLTVARGLWGTAITSHGATAGCCRRLHGSTTSVASDANMNGTPSRNDANYPIRYVLKVWLPTMQNWLAGRINATFGGDGYNTVWLDVSTCTQYGLAAADSDAISAWDDQNATRMTDTQWGLYQKEKVAGLRTILPGWNLRPTTTTTTTSRAKTTCWPTRPTAPCSSTG